MEPLNLPRGSMRALITLALVLGFIPVAIFGPSEGMSAFAALAGVAIRDYFASRQEQNRQDGPPLPPLAS